MGQMMRTIHWRVLAAAEGLLLSERRCAGGVGSGIRSSGGPSTQCPEMELVGRAAKRVVWEVELVSGGQPVATGEGPAGLRSSWWLESCAS